MQAINDFNLEHVVLALEDVNKKIMDVEDGYTLQYDVKTNIILNYNIIHPVTSFHGKVSLSIES